MIAEYIQHLFRDDHKYRLVIFSIIIAVGVLSLLGAIALFLLGKGFMWPGNAGDFIDCWDAAHSYISGGSMYTVAGRSLYDRPLYLYGPISIFFFVPFAYLPIYEAGILMTVLDFVMLGLTTLVISKILHAYGVSLSTLELSALFVAILFIEFVTGRTGQIDILMLLILTAFYYSLFVKRQKTLSSFLLATVIFIKIWPAILIFLNFVNRRAKGVFLRCCVFISIFGIVSLVIFGLSTHIDFFHVLTTHGNAPLYLPLNDALRIPNWSDGNGSPLNVVFKIVSTLGLDRYYSAVSILVNAFKFIVFATAVLWMLRISKNDKNIKQNDWDILSFSLLTILTFVILPISWNHYVVFLILPITLLLFTIQLTVTDKALLATSVFFFAIHSPVEKLSNIMGPPLKSIEYFLNPSAIAYVLFLLVIINVIREKTNQHLIRKSPT